ncbi:MAG: hypothetical protein ABWY13_11210 [Mesorhizobium sp.]|jgi:acyl-CoA synthetase (NDP forming)|nr:hypothetical protein [Mesorhizobium sp.]
MTRSLTFVLNILRHLPRVAAIMLLLWSPLFAMQSVRADTGSTIEAPAQKKKGMGLVILVSLQRN